MSPYSSRRWGGEERQSQVLEHEAQSDGGDDMGYRG
jgi:hypothetical protein